MLYFKKYYIFSYFTLHNYVLLHLHCSVFQWFTIIVK